MEISINFDKNGIEYSLDSSRISKYVFSNGLNIKDNFATFSDYDIDFFCEMNLV